MRKAKITLMIADDHDLLREGLNSLIQGGSRKMKVIGLAANGKELLALVAKEVPDVILLDLEMPVLDGKETLQILQVKYPSVKVIILSLHYHNAFITEFIKRGAMAYLPKTCSAEKLIDTILLVQGNEAYFDEKISLSMYKRIRNSVKINYADGDTGLTRREAEILTLVCKGISSDNIAQKLKISKHTVTFHRINIMKKTRIKTVAGLTQFAMRNNLI